MARRPETESEGSSQNIDERPIGSQVLSQPNGSQVPEESEDEDERTVDEGLVEQNEEDHEGQGGGGDEDEDEDGESSPRGHKRARLENGVDAVKTEKPRRTGMLPRDVDGYVPGSVVRVKLHQFLTYDDVEFRPGPHLNMVLGPNGTGKSSIACALCLGLNFPPNVLGRATHLKAFVKQGYKDGFIEIELKGRIGERNLVIRRLLHDKMERQQQFLLDGEQVSHKVISEKVAELGIQVNNLCTFLPQDKVAEFARMTPQELLIATEKAAGDEHLLEWHQTLIETGKELQKLSSDLAIEQDVLANHEARNAKLEKEVNAYKQRREIERRLELLGVVLPCKEYMQAKVEYDRLKEIRINAHARVTELEQRNKPVIDFRAKLEADQRRAEQDRDRKKAQVRGKSKIMTEIMSKNAELETKGEEISDQLINLKTEERQRKQRIAAIKAAIYELEETLAHPQETEDLADIEADRRAIVAERQAVSDQHHELENVIKPFLDESARQEEMIRRGNIDLQRLDDAAHRKLAALEHWDRSCAEVVRWLRANQGRFRMQVIEPACLSVQVKDQRFATAIEAGFNANQLKTFVFQCKDDYKLFNQLVCDSPQALGRKVRVGTWQRDMTANDINPPPMGPEELREVGFDGYGIDFINYPPGMLGFLQTEPNMHRFAVALRENSVDIGRAAELISRPLPGNKGGVGSFVVGNVLSIVQRSRYGQRKAQNMTREIKRAQSFNNAPVDQERKHTIEQGIARANSLKTEAESEIERIAAQIKEVENANADLDRRKAEVEDRKKAVLAVQRAAGTAKIRLQTKQDALAREESVPAAEEKRERLRQEGYKIAKERANVALQLQDAIKDLIAIHKEATILALQYIQAGANKKALDHLVESQDTEYSKARQDFTSAHEEFTEAKNIAKEKLAMSKAKLAEIDEELRMTYKELEDSEEYKALSCEKIQVEMDDLSAKLGLLLMTNSGVIEQYEKRQRDIEKSQIKVKEHERKKAKAERRIQKTKDHWLPALQELVASIGEKFSAAFERVNCAGEIRIAENADDYAAWAIDILVKFRDTEQLQLLTGQRQSGGERALTTIMYLMSLTENARAPFSLVDEINQGMDARYERAVHNSLVEVTCRAESGQYFLITPKLLTGLDYHERMKVLCVSNGEWLPDENRGGNLMRMIEGVVARRGRTP